MKECEMSARVSGTIKALQLAGDYLEACKANGLPDLGAASDMPWVDDAIGAIDAALAAIQPDPEPKPVATTKQNYGDCLSSDLEPQPMAFGRQHFEPKRDSDRQPWDATPSSAGTVSVEKAAQVALDCAHGYVEMGNIVKAEACWFVACQIVALAGDKP